jgi:hypothetical protein
VLDLRALATAVIPLPADRIDWSAFGAVGIDKPGPSPLNPADGVWARVTLAEAPSGQGGWSWAEKIGTMVIELRGESPADQDSSGLAVMASEIESELKRSEVGTIGFESAWTVSVDTQQSRQQLNVLAIYRRIEYDAETNTREPLPVNYTIPGHSFTVMQLVRPTGAGTFALALADDPANCAQALIVSVVGDRVSMRHRGPVRITHGLGDGTGPNNNVYASQAVAGAPTVTTPGAGVAQRVGVIVSTTELLLTFDQPEVQ